jgi:hypothetical protein
MSSVISNISQNPYGVTAAVLSGGNGSNGTTQLAIATIDPRYGNAFTVDTSTLTNSGAGQYRVYIRLRAVKPYVGTVYPGKIINILFKMPAPTGSNTRTINCYFDSSLGSNIDELSTGGGGVGRAPAFSLIADGTQFQMLSNTIEWGWN